MSLTARSAAVADAARRGAITIATDPAVQHYCSATVALVYQRTIVHLVGSGAEPDELVRLLSSDPLLEDVPDQVVDVIAAASFSHFSRALLIRS